MPSCPKNHDPNEKYHLNDLSTMKIIRKIALTELQTLFYSPVAWFILIVFAFQCAMAYTGILTGNARAMEMNWGLQNVTLNMFGGMRGLFTQVQNYLYLYIPLLTMGLMSREFSSGSIKLLYSSPVKNSQIILGKFLSMVVYGFALMLILLIFALIGISTVKEVDVPVIFSGMLGLYLLTLAYASIGIFMSSLTSYQVVAAIGTLAILAVLNFIGGIGQSIDFVREITFWLSIGGRASESINGLICSEDVIYFLVVIALFLSLSALRLKSVRQKEHWSTSIGKYIGVFVVALMVGYFSARPKLMFFYDATRTKQRTLTENSQEIIKQAKGGLTISTFVNVLEDNMSNGLPSSRMWDLKRFEQYTRFKPEIKIKYYYYYQIPAESNLDRRYPGLTDLEMVGKIAKAYDIDSAMFKPLNEQVAKIVDLEPEGYRFVRQMEREGGEKTFLRIFDDMMRHPSEREISASLKRMVMDLPVVGFVAGHGDRGITREGDRGYSRFSQDRPFRYSLINQGFNVEEIRLEADIPAHIDILVVSDFRHALSSEEQSRLERYIARGGNLLIAADRRRQDAMNPILAQLGIRVLPGQLVKRIGAGKESKEDIQADLILARPTPEATRMSYWFETMHRRRQVVTMPGCLAMEYTTDKGYQVTPLFTSDSTDSWNELETTNFVDDTVRINPAIGEVERSYATILGLTRQVNGNEQRIIVMSDADCISNAEISMNRARISAANFDMLMGSFFWLSNDEVPIDVRRTPPPDNAISMSGSEVKVWKWILMGLLPLMLLASCLIIWLRRRGR